MGAISGWLVALVLAALAGVLGTLLWKRRFGSTTAAGEDPAAARTQEAEARAATDQVLEDGQRTTAEARRRAEEAEDAIRRRQTEQRGETIDETLDRLGWDGGPAPGGPFADRMRPPGGGAGAGSP